MSPIIAANLTEQLELLIEKKIFLTPNLKVSDLAKMLGTNSRYVQQVLNEEIGMSFSDFINRKRIDYAEQLFASQPDMDINDVWSKSGFSSSSTFYRNYKMYKGKSPKK